MKAKWEYRFG